MKTMRVLLFLLLGSRLVYSQFEYAEILGTVRDTSPGVVTGARITLRNLDTNIEQQIVTNEQGAYSFPGLRPGHYSVRAEKPGFRVATTSDLELRTGAHLRDDFTLEPGAVTETVNVGADAPLLETDTSERGQLIQGEQIRELPLNKRDYTQLVLLAPGTTFNLDQRLGGAISVNGNRSLQNDYLLDGLDNNSHATSYRGDRVDVILPSVDAVQEFRVQSNAYSAEYGHSAGAVVNVSIKNGTNRFNGTLWEFFRNDALDAHGWTPTLGGVKPEVRFNLFGANIGGPIVKDRTFFFVNYEGDREHNGVIFQATVPTAALVAGNFANAPTGLGSTLRVLPVDPTTNQPFPNGVIPVSRWSPVATKILNYQYFPKSNAAPLITTPGAYINTVINTVRADKFDIRIDHNLTAKSRFFGRYSYSNSDTFRPAPFQGYAEGSNNDQFGETPIRAYSGAVGNTTVLTPTTILDSRIGFTRLEGQVFPPNFGSPCSTQLLGIPNLPCGPQINAGWPKFSISGLSAFGSTTSQPQYQIPNTYLASSVLSLQRGAHNIRLGGDATYIQTAILDVSALRGTFTFSNTWTGNPWGDFLLGLPAAYTQTSPTVAYNRNWIYNFFIQDDYRIFRNLTLNIGLRYEFGTPIFEKFNHLSNYSLATGQLILADSNNRSLVNDDLLNFAPRVGLAWTVFPKIVIRSAYGQFYQHTFRQGRENLLAENPPFLHDLTRTQGPGAAPFVTLDAGPPANFFASALPTDQAVRGNDPNLKAGNVQQWNFTLQYSFAKDWLFEAGYVGNRGTHLSRFWNANQPHAAGTSATLAARRPNPGFGDVEYMDSGGSSFYNSFQTRLEKRFSNGLTLLHSFTWARGLDNVGAWNDPNGSLYPQDAYNFANEKALAENIVKINSVTNWVYELPFGSNRKYMSRAPMLVNAIAGGWQFDGIWNWRTGLPLTINSAACAACQMGGDRSIRGNYVSGVPVSVSNPGPAGWFNVNAFTPQTTPYGTVGRDTIWGPGYQGWDLGFAKRFGVSESRYFQFRGELFNAFNQVNFAPPASTVGSAGFGTITAARPGRNVQLGLKFYW